MAAHSADLTLCRKLPGTNVGRLCRHHDGQCVICDSFVRPAVVVHICDECCWGRKDGRCIICSGEGVADAYYCEECVQLGKARDGCPRITNIGINTRDRHFEKTKSYGFKKR